MGCGSSSANKGGEINNVVASNNSQLPPDPLQVPPRPQVPYVAPSRAPPPKAAPPPQHRPVTTTTRTQYTPPAPAVRAPVAPAAAPAEIDFNPQQLSATTTTTTTTTTQRTVRSSLGQPAEKSPHPKERASRKDKSPKSKTRGDKSPRKGGTYSSQGHTASLSLQAAQQKGPVVDHRKSTTSQQQAARTTAAASVAPPQPAVVKEPAPQPKSAPKEHPQPKSAPPAVGHSPPPKDPPPAVAVSEPKPTKTAVVVDNNAIVKKKKSKQSRKDYDRVQSNKGMKMSDIPQPDSKSGKPFSELYRLKGVLGTGAFSTVREGYHKSNADLTYAVKCVTRAKLSEEDEAALLDEVSILKEMNHVHIIRLYDFFEEPNTYYLIMERMSGGELFDRIVAKAYYNEKEARDTCKILLEAVGYCHVNQVAHRDLKPENLLLRSEDDDSAVKIADFGFAKKVLEPRSLQTQCGTPGYVAPEILEGVPYDTKSDMWSVGVILYILLGGYPPFIENNQRDLFRKIRRGEYEFHEEYWGNVSTGAKDLISSLLTVDPDVRLDAQEALDNAWIRQDDESLEKKDLGVNLEEFKKFNAKRKFKAAVSTVLAVNKLQSLGKDFLKSLQD